MKKETGNTNPGKISPELKGGSAGAGKKGLVDDASGPVYETETDDDGECDDASEEELFEHFNLEADKGQNQIRVDKYITDHVIRISRNKVQMAIDAGYVKVNGKAVKSNYKVKPLDKIKVMMPYERHRFEITPENIPLDIVYEDEALLIVNKPAGMVVHPGLGHFYGTLLNALAYHVGMRGTQQGKDERLGMLVHRIDKDTSGLLVVAKTDEAQMKLAKQFFYHTIEREYVALVWGNLADEEGTVDCNIARDPRDRMRFAVTEDPEKGKHAVTHYKVMERFGYVTLIKCRLETGRTHQIRVHMNHIGHPLFNDSLYGGDRILKGALYAKYKRFIDNCFEVLPRQALHAHTLGFIHPETGEKMFFEAPVPDDMASVIEKWRSYSNFSE